MRIEAIINNPIPRPRTARITLLTSLAMLLSFIVATSPARADSEARSFHFDISPETLSQALRSYGQVSGQEIIFTEDLVDGKTVAALKGDFTAQAALDLLLRGTGLTVERSPTGALMIRRPRQGARISSATPSTLASAATNDSPSTDRTRPSSETANSGRDAGGSESLQLEEVVVTALKRTTNLQDTPISITAISAANLQQTGATDIEDVFRQVPNVNLEPGPFGGNRLSIRGVQSSGEATTGLYYDETPVTGPSGTTQDPGNNAASLNLFDVERVEVLRGPQGTLFGSGSMGGTVRVIYNKPDPTRYAGAVDAEYTGTQSGGEGYFVKAMGNVPLIDDQLALRVSGYDERRPGFIDNIYLNEQNINYSESDGVHAALLYRPFDELSITATAIYQRQNAPNQIGWYQALGKYNTDSPVNLPFDNTMRLYNLTANWDTPVGRITATVSRYTYDVVRTYDFTTTVAAVAQSPGLCPVYFGIAAACTPAQQAAFTAYGASRQPAFGYQPASLATWTGETRITGSRGPWAWTGGAYYEDRQDHIDSYIATGDAATGGLVLPLNVTSHRYIDTPETQRSEFGEVSYNLFEPLTLTAGVRHFDYDKSTDGAVVTPNVIAALFPAPYTRVSTNATGWVDKFNLAYKITADLMAYGTYSEGFRPGGANNIPGLPADLVTYKPDRVRNYELGVKSSWFDRRLIVDVSGFLIKWYDLQTLEPTANGLFTFMTNAGRAEIPGAELDITGRPLRGLTLDAGMGYADPHLTQNQASVLGAQSSANGLAGEQFPDVPKITASASALYEWPVTTDLSGLARLDWNYSGSRVTAFQPTDISYAREPGFSTVGFRTGVQEASWEVDFFVRNLTNSNGILFAYSTIGITDQLFTATPRTLGVEARKTF